MFGCCKFTAKVSIWQELHLPASHQGNWPICMSVCESVWGDVRALCPSVVIQRTAAIVWTCVDVDVMCYIHISCYCRQQDGHLTHMHTNMHIWSNPPSSFLDLIRKDTFAIAHTHTNPSAHSQPSEQLGAGYQTVRLKCRILENKRAVSREPHP